jgi:hypothetical protein
MPQTAGLRRKKQQCRVLRTIWSVQIDRKLSRQVLFVTGEQAKPAISLDGFIHPGSFGCWRIAVLRRPPSCEAMLLRYCCLSIITSFASSVRHRRDRGIELHCIPSWSSASVNACRNGSWARSGWASASPCFALPRMLLRAGNEWLKRLSG